MIMFLYLVLCFMLPNTIWLLMNKHKLMRKRNAIRHIVWTVIFWLYCALATHVTGIGTIWDIIAYKEVMGGFNFIPFSSEGFLTYFLNIVMLMPFGFLVPFIWREYRNFGKVFLAGFGFSLLIEIFQIFSRRLSDIDDLMMNTLGACVGYFIWIVYSNLFRPKGKYLKNKAKITGFSKAEPITYVVLGILGVFLLYNWRPLDAALAAKNYSYSDNSSIVETANNANSNESATPTIDTGTKPNTNAVARSGVAVVVCNDGTVEELTHEELVNKYYSNLTEFQQRYVDAKITVVGIPVGIGVNSFGDGTEYRSITFSEGWRIEVEYNGYDLIDKIEEERRIATICVESFIADVVEFEKGKPQVILGSWDEEHIGRTVFYEVE